MFWCLQCLICGNLVSLPVMCGGGNRMCSGACIFRGHLVSLPMMCGGGNKMCSGACIVCGHLVSLPVMCLHIVQLVSDIVSADLSVHYQCQLLPLFSLLPIPAALSFPYQCEH